MESSIKILLVEDEELTRLGIKAALERTKEVSVIGEAADGITAVELAAKLEHDVILMDIGLPFMNGVDAAIKIHEQNPHARCLMLTSHKEANQIFAALNAGARGYSQKTVSASRLLAAIKAVHLGDVWLDPEIASVIFSNLNKPAPEQSEKHAPAVTLQSTVAASKNKDNSNKSAGAATRETLTERELEVLSLMVSGLRNIEIAEKLYISVDTVKSHMSHIIEKLSVADRTQAAIKALRSGLVSL